MLKHACGCIPGGTACMKEGIAGGYIPDSAANHGTPAPGAASREASVSSHDGKSRAGPSRWTGVGRCGHTPCNSRFHGWQCTHSRPQIASNMHVLSASIMSAIECRVAHHGATQEARSRCAQARGSTLAAAPAGCAAVQAEPHDPVRCLASRRRSFHRCYQGASCQGGLRNRAPAQRRNGST